MCCGLSKGRFVKWRICNRLIKLLLQHMLLLLCSNKGTRCTRAIVSIIDANVLRTTIEFFFTLTLSLPFTAFFVWAAFQGQCLDGFSHKRRFPSTLHWHPQVAKFYFLANSFDDPGAWKVFSWHNLLTAFLYELPIAIHRWRCPPQDFAIGSDDFK